MSSVWLPGRGRVDFQVLRVDRAVKEYDERLSFDVNPDTGLYTIFMKMAHGEPDLPILAFPNGCPHPEDAKKRLYETDTLRHGEKILDDMNRHNELLRAPYEHAASEGSGVTADAMESFLHRQGKTPYHRSLRKRDPKQRSTK